MRQFGDIAMHKGTDAAFIRPDPIDLFGAP
jgi:hypothetical protein